MSTLQSNAIAAGTVVRHWMSWEGGVDLVAFSQPGLAMPDVIVHFARMVHTPVGSAPSGMVLIPGPGGMPRLVGFVSEREELARYFGPTVFAGTPFEGGPAHVGRIAVEQSGDQARVRVEVGGTVVESHLAGLGPLLAADRAPGALPFHDRSLEAAAATATLRVDGVELPITVPPAGLSGGPAAVWAPAGIYSR